MKSIFHIIVSTFFHLGSFVCSWMPLTSFIGDILRGTASQQQWGLLMQNQGLKAFPGSVQIVFFCWGGGGEGEEWMFRLVFGFLPLLSLSLSCLSLFWGVFQVLLWSENDEGTELWSIKRPNCSVNHWKPWHDSSCAGYTTTVDITDANCSSERSSPWSINWWSEDAVDWGETYSCWVGRAPTFFFGCPYWWDLSRIALFRSSMYWSDVKLKLKGLESGSHL